MPVSTVAFDTTAGQYQIDNGPWLSGGVLSPDPSQTTMLFDFTTITLNSTVTVTASGANALGLMATG
ncbi:MAG TPA: hypothetical protein VKU02_28430, partial [Gemmataceae bacterium]|nr:hypothetical protein [Gemmataceae bacterium]